MLMIKKILVKVYGLRRKRDRQVFFCKLVNTPLMFARILKNFLFNVVLGKAAKFIPNRLKPTLLNVFPFLRSRAGTRRYLRADFTIEEFFQILRKRNIEYVVLRWFNNLPQVKDGEDLDLLVADKDLNEIRDLFGYDSSKQKFDIYSVSGLSGSDYKKIPYYPVHLAQKILEDRVFYKNLYTVPSPTKHYLSMLYHVVFHKGEKSGLLYGGKTCSRSKKSDHDYTSVINDIAEKNGFQKVDQNFETYYGVLEKEYWIPELDTLRILAQSDEWLSKLLKIDGKTDLEDQNLMVFVIRDWVVKNCKMDTVLDYLKLHLIDVISIHHLDEKQKEKAAKYIRGGKWDKGPYPKSGGKPVAFIICYDYQPKWPSQFQLKLYPNLKNANTLIKHKIRDFLNAELFMWNHVNALHSSDDQKEAFLYIEKVIPDQKKHVQKKILKRREAYNTKHPVLYLYPTQQTRSKIERIDYNGKTAIKKTFKLGQERFAKREKMAYEQLSSKISTVPTLLESGDNYVIIPFFYNTLDELNKSARKKKIKCFSQEIIDTMKAFYEKGYALIGFYDGNLLVTPSGKLKIIDYEFLYKYKKCPESFEKSYDIIGVPKGFDGDLPRGIKGKGHTYKNTWQSLLGPLKQYLVSSIPSQKS